MLRKSNLRLLLQLLERLSETPYFNPELDQYLLELIAVPNALLSRLNGPLPINEKIADYIEKNLWSLTQFLTGSTTKQIPYEVVFAVSQAAKQWTREKLLVTTAIIQEPNFYFKGVQASFFDTIETELGVKITSRPVQIALPYIYRHKPLFCVPLFHEVGHYIDKANNLAGMSMLTFPMTRGPAMPGLPAPATIATYSTEKQKNAEQVILRHRQEYFADLFAAMYVGHACADFLNQFAPAQTVSATHPATADRYAVVADFLAGNANIIVSMFNAVLKQKGLPAISGRFSPININTAFDDVRPITPKSVPEVFGLFKSAWEFMRQLEVKKQGTWAVLAEAEQERITNDLVEKSIRNYMVEEGWNAAAGKI